MRSELCKKGRGSHFPHPLLPHTFRESMALPTPCLTSDFWPLPHPPLSCKARNCLLFWAILFVVLGHSSSRCTWHFTKGAVAFLLFSYLSSIISIMYFFETETVLYRCHTPVETILNLKVWNHRHKADCFHQ